MESALRRFSRILGPVVLTSLAFLVMHPASSASTRTADAITWLLPRNGQSTNSVVDDGHFDSLLRLVVPSATLDLGAGRQQLRRTFWEFLHGPPNDIIVEDNRYIIFSACRAHFCPEKAWLWCDATDGVVAGALVHYIFKGEDNGQPSLLLFSNQPTDCTLPSRCQLALDAWLKANDISPLLQRCVNSKGVIKEMKQ